MGMDGNGWVGGKYLLCMGAGKRSGINEIRIPSLCNSVPLCLSIAAARILGVVFGNTEAQRSTEEMIDDTWEEG